MALPTLPTDAAILVVGGGPAGASTAWHCARAGHDVVLVDRAQFPRTKPCAEYVSPEGSRILANMGALSAIEAQATALTGMVVHTPSGHRIHGEFISTHGYHGFRDTGLGIRREVLDTIVLNRARDAGVHVVENAKVESLIKDSTGRVSGVTVRTADGVAHVRTGMVIGADGLRSVVAKRLNLAKQARWPNRLAFVAHFEHMPDVSSLGEMHVTANGYVGVAQVGDGLTNIAAVVPASHAREAAGRAEEYFAQWLAHSPIGKRIAAATQRTPVRVTGPFASHSRRPGAPGAMLVGDAADFFDPFTGEGIYSALRGGELVAPFAIAALQAGARGDMRAEHDALHAYDRARKSALGGKWRVERLIGRAVSSPTAINFAAKLIGPDRQLADLLIGVAGDFIPPSALLSPRMLIRFTHRLLQRTLRLAHVS